jgi:hypothetical protein
MVPCQPADPADRSFSVTSGLQRSPSGEGHHYFVMPAPRSEISTADASVSTGVGGRFNPQVRSALP